MAYKNILVGIDGSKRAERAFETAVDLAKVFSAKLYLVWVVNRDRGMDSSFGVNEDFYQDFAKRTKKQLQIYLKKAQDKGADASADVMSIIETAKRNGLDVYGYLLYLLTKLPEWGDAPTDEQLETVMPWSSELPEYCRQTYSEIQ